MRKILLITISIIVFNLCFVTHLVYAKQTDFGKPVRVYIGNQGNDNKFYKFDSSKGKWQVMNLGEANWQNFNYPPGLLTEIPGLRHFLDILKNSTTLVQGYFVLENNKHIGEETIKKNNYDIDSTTGHLIQTGTSTTTSPGISTSPGTETQTTSPGNTTSPTATSGVTTFGNTLPEYISNLYNWSIGVAAGLAIIMLIYAGYLYVTSAGNPESINLAKEIIVGAIAGFVLLVLAALILKAVMT